MRGESQAHDRAPGSRPQPVTLRASSGHKAAGWQIDRGERRIYALSLPFSALPAIGATWLLQGRRGTRRDRRDPEPRAGAARDEHGEDARRPTLCNGRGVLMPVPLLSALSCLDKITSSEAPSAAPTHKQLCLRIGSQGGRPDCALRNGVVT
ncbi:hypothetical protein [Kozakia baliensis]|uniref:hypothetical protein n=1 Tax=Kozakia baliensis TaxID=153496 RepID=UPI001267E18E|nr:hypothetical protein [Kozakia baliensis]